MKHSIKLFAAIAVLGLAGTASAQNSANAIGTANATIIAPITLRATHALNFGNIVAGNGTVTELGGSNTYNPLSLTPGTQIGTPSDATFAVTGQPAFNFAITTPAGTTVTDGTTTLNVDLLSAAAGTLDGTGNATVTVSGTLHDLSTATTAHTYTGTWSETVAYN